MTANVSTTALLQRIRRFAPTIVSSLMLGCASVPPGTSDSRQAESATAPSVACDDPTIIHATLYTAPHSPPVEDATLVLEDGHITRIVSGDAATDSSAQEHVEPPRCLVDAAGRIVVAGFWNAHVHHTDPALRDESQADALIRQMFVNYGFTSVVDTGADPHLLSALRQAIESGRVVGPRIVAAGGSFVYKDGTPAYLPKGLLPEVTAPQQADAAVASALRMGANGIKIFSGSFQAPNHTILLPPDVIRAITESAHTRGAFVISHPTDRAGLVNAVDNGVDVLAHTAPPAGVWEPELLERMMANRVALIPTLMLWRWELQRVGVPPAGINAYVETAVAQLRDFHRAGGEVIFGTDVGYMHTFDPREEFELMARAGMDFHAILAALTTNPARRFGGTAGTLDVGEPADVVILDRDPGQDARAFAAVAITIRGGRVQFQR